MTKRLAMIDFMRFVFSLIIVFYHAGAGFFYGGYIAVEFFFIVTGYMLAQSYEKTEHSISIGQDTVGFLIKKFKSFCPNVYIAFFIAFFVNHGSQSLSDILDWFVHDFFGFMLVHMIGLGDDPINGVVWYLSATLVAIFFIYPLMRKYSQDDEFYYIIAPLGFLIGMGCLAQNIGALSITLQWNGILRWGLLRAVTEILGGCVLYKISSYVRKIKFSTVAKTLFTGVEIISYLFVVIYSYNHYASFTDFFLLFILMIGVLISSSDISYTNLLLNAKCTHWLGKYSFSLFLGHDFWRQYLVANNIEGQSLLILYLLLSFLTGLIIMYLSKGVVYMWKKYEKIIGGIIFS